MDKEQILTALKNLTKTELIDIIDELLADEDFSFEGLCKKLTTESKMSADEEVVKDKILNQQELTTTDNELIKETLEKIKNRKIGNIIKAKSSFDGFLVNRKLQYVFEKCWDIYPRKVGKQQGAKAFLKLFNDVKYANFKATAEYIVRKIIEYKNDCERENKESQYILHFATFCNSKKYL